jgi:hypothetical protein
MGERCVPCGILWRPRLRKVTQVVLNGRERYSRQSKVLFTKLASHCIMNINLQNLERNNAEVIDVKQEVKCFSNLK